MKSPAFHAMSGCIGLHHTNFLIRRHLKPRCILFCTEWWEELSRHSKRDQLSFDFVRWKLPQVKVATIPISYNDNALFRCAGGHRNLIRMVSEHFASGVRRDGLPHPFLAAPYLARYDSWPATFLKHLRQLNEIVAATGEPIEGNLCYFHHQENFLHSPPDPRRGARRETFLRTLAGRRRVFEIGFNAGHSALLALGHSDAAFTAVDNGEHAYTEPAAAYLRNAFAGRLQFFKMDSRELPTAARELDLGEHDMIHIDGGHGADVFASDVNTAIAFGKPGMRVLIDDIYLPWIRDITDQLVSVGLLAPDGDLETMESGAYVILDNAQFDQATVHVARERKLPEDVDPPPPPNEAVRSRFMVALLHELDLTKASDRPASECAPESFDAAPALALDGELIDEIKRLGFHAWIIARNASEPADPRFLVCATQNEIPQFIKELAATSAFANSKLLRGIERALQFQIGEAAELLFAWSTEGSQERSERICLGLPPAAELPVYYGYPIYEVAPAAAAYDPSMRARELLALLEAYERADGNDRSRFALIEALALAVVRHLGRQDQFAQAAKIIARVYKIHRASTHLRSAINALDLRSRSALTGPRPQATAEQCGWC
jgi:hypothetical protein